MSHATTRTQRGPRPPCRSWVWALPMIALVACSGEIDGTFPGEAPGAPAPGGADDVSGAAGPGRGDPGGPTGPMGGAGSQAPVSPPKQAPPARVRRLSGEEINNSIADVLLGGQPLERPLAPEIFAHAFDNEIANLGVPLQFAQDLQETAERAAAQAAKNLASLVDCNPTAKGEPACAAQTVDELGLQLYRRPVAPAEKTDLVATFTAARKIVPYPQAIGTVLEAMLQSPNFIFRPELGAPGKPAKVAPLEPYETASALSYLLWRSAPDRALLDAARSGALRHPAGVAAEARRLAADPKARRGLRSFLMQWLELSDPARVSKDPQLVPGFSPELMAALFRETELFVDDVLWSRGGTLNALLTSNATFVNADSAKLYGLAGVTGKELRPATVDARQRSGVLTQPAFLASHIPGNAFGPIGLGQFVRTRLLCQPLPPPPPDIPPLPAATRTSSTRERFAMHASRAECASCHALMDPIGFGFERFDPLGRYREREPNGVALTGEGEIKNADVAGAFVGPAALAGKLLASGEVRACMAAQALRFATGRDVIDRAARVDADEKAIARAAAGALNLRELLVAMATSEAALYRDTTNVEVQP